MLINIDSSTFRDYFVADKLFLAVNDYDNLNWKVIEKIRI